MNRGRITLIDGKRMFIRLPKNLEDCSELKLVLPKEMAGMTIEVTTDGKCSVEPFDEQAIYADGDTFAIRYYGSDTYWKPEKVTRTVVEGNPHCEYGECQDCHNVTCLVYQGYMPSSPLEIEYLQSKR